MLQNIGFIGTGNIGKAIISRICSFKDRYRIFGYDKNCNNYEFLKKNDVCLCEIQKLIENCKYIILAVKPQDYPFLLDNIKTYVSKDKVIVSLAAGIDEKFVCSYFGFCPKFIQVMPNTPMILGFGSIAVAKGKNIEKAEFEFTVDIFSKVGVVSEIEPENMNYIIPINGSSPAFIYLFSECFLDYAKEKKIEENVAKKLFCHSLIGSAKMMLESKKTIKELIEEVSSKKGTTIEGLNFLKNNRFEEIVKQACKQTAKRAFELSK